MDARISVVNAQTDTGDGNALAGRSRILRWLLLAGGLAAFLAAGSLAIPVLDKLARPGSTMLFGLIAGCALLAAWRVDTATGNNHALAIPACLEPDATAACGAPLAQPAGRDPLTGLANRSSYEAWLGDHWELLAGSGGPLGLVVIEVDHFGTYIDYYGHAASDVCLQTVARCLRDQLRGTTDQVARTGGAAFAVVLPGLAQDLCGDVAERLRATVAIADLPHLGAPPPRRVTLSCGAVSFAATGLGATGRVTVAALVAAAQAALSHARQAGGNRVCLADQPRGDASQAAVPPAQAHT